MQQMMYQTAMERQDQERKRRKLLLFIIVSGKRNYIDKIFKSGLQNYTLQPGGNVHEIFNQVSWNNLKNPRLFYRNFFHSPGVWIAGTVSVVTISALLILHSIKHPTLNNAIVTDTITSISKMDSTQIKLTDCSFVNDSTATLADSSQKQPVVVKKIQIQKHIVTVKDTVQIIDSTDAE